MKKTAARKTEAVGDPVAVTKTAVKALDTKPAAAKPAQTKVAAKSPPVALATTTIVAQVDVGWGNFLTLRGLGAGLSWGKSAQMRWEDGAWVWSAVGVTEDFEFKTLLNDRVWQKGDNLKAKAGQKNVFRPGF